MSNRDLTSNVTSKLAQSATISTNTTTNGTGVDTARGVMGVGFVATCTAFSAGTFNVVLEDSDDNITFGAIGASQLIGSPATITAGDVIGTGTLKKIGAFGTKRYVRPTIVSTGASGSNIFVVVAQQEMDIKP